MILVITSCGSKNIVPEKIASIDSSRLVFLTYSIAKTDSSRKAELINKKITEGKLKNRKQNFIESPTVNDLKCSQLDANASELTSVFIKNPLIRIMESLNDSLSFSQQKIEQNRTLLSLRLQLHPKTEFISLSYITDSSNNTIELNKFPIK